MPKKLLRELNPPEWGPWLRLMEQIPLEWQAFCISASCICSARAFSLVFFQGIDALKKVLCEHGKHKLL